MGVGEVLDNGFRLARQNYRLLATTTAYAVAPAFVIGAILDLVVRVPSIGSVAIVIGELLAWLALVFACSHLIAPTGLVGELQPGPLYRLARARVLRTIVWGVVVGVISIPLAILFPLGIYVWTRWSVSLMGVVIEGDGPIESLRRSWRLTRRAWWHTLGVFVVSGLIIGIASAVVSGIFGAIGAVLTLTGSAAVGGVFSIFGSSLATIFVTPFSVAISVVLYYELRARQEGFDLESRARQQWQAS
jgi:hypothetical protein